MQAIYKPSGKAKEYGQYACNLYKGCGHGCTYCYAAMMAKRYGNDEFFTNPQPREGVIEQLRKDAKKLIKKYLTSKKYQKYLDILNPDIKQHDLDLGTEELLQLSTYGYRNYPPPEPPFVFLCFSCDPYQLINQEHQLTRQAIEMLHGEGLGVNILTKGVITDFGLLAKNPHLSKVGVTLTTLPTSPSEDIYEKNARGYVARIENIVKANALNIKTWVSLEPVIDPAATLEAIKMVQFLAGGISGEYKLGKWNYSPEAKLIDWHKFVNEAIELCEKLGVKYYIKENLRKYI